MPVLSNAYVSPVSPIRATCRIREKLSSGLSRRHKAAAALSLRSDTGAAANIVGMPARHVPSESGSITRLGMG
jgi:hypothetical protein